jgi:hypothetical protein
VKTAALKDVIGKRGENIVELCLTEYSNFPEPLFNLTHLGDFYPMDTRWYKRLAHSNVPSLLLVVDAKHNNFYFAWPGDEDVNSSLRKVRVRVAPVDDKVKEQIRERLAGSEGNFAISNRN